MKKLEKDNPDSKITSIICWDSGQYEERMRLSEAGVTAGIIGKTYKQARREKKLLWTEDEKLEHADMGRQLDILNEILQQTAIAQVKVDGEEADDVCASYVEKHKNDYDTIYIVTSDHDHYQLLDENVVVYDAIKRNLHTLDSFRGEYNIEPWQWVDACSFIGDTGDTIIGCTGFAIKTTMPYIVEHKTVDGVYKYFHELTDELRKQYPDVELTDELVESMQEKYPKLKLETSICSGIRIALAERTLKKLPFPKVILNAIEQEDRVHLAYKLKKMRRHLELLDIEERETDDCVLEDLFKEYNFFTLLKDVDYFLGKTFDKVKVNNAINSIVGNISDKKMYKCPHCNEDFMSSNELDKCPNCNESMKEREMVQPSLF